MKVGFRPALPARRSGF